MHASVTVLLSNLRVCTDADFAFAAWRLKKRRSDEGEDRCPAEGEGRETGRLLCCCMGESGERERENGIGIICIFAPLNNKISDN